MEIFNLVVTFFVVIFLNAFVGNTYDPDTKYTLGWIPTGLMSFYIIIWLIVIFSESTCNLIYYLKLQFVKGKEKCKKVCKDILKKKEKPKIEIKVEPIHPG